MVLRTLCFTLLNLKFSLSFIPPTNFQYFYIGKPKFNCFMSAEDYPQALTQEEERLKELWDSVLVQIKKDLAYVWTNTVQINFKKIEAESGRIAFIIRKLYVHKRIDKSTWEKIRQDIRILLKHLNKIESKPKWVKLIHNDLQQIINDLEKETEELRKIPLPEEELFKEFIFDYLLLKYPQVDSSGNILYYFCGSSAAILLGMADSMQTLNKKSFPFIKLGQTVRISRVKTFYRKIKDFDLVIVTRPNSKRPIPVVLPVPYKFLPLFKDNIRNVKCESSDTYKIEEVVKVNVPKKNGIKSAYVLHPYLILGYKLAFFFERAEQKDMFYKTFGDLQGLIEGLTSAVPIQKLINYTSKFIFYEFRNSDKANIPYHFQEFQGMIRQFVELIIKRHPDSKYIENITFPHNKDLEIVILLSKFKSAKSKRLIIWLLNRYPNYVVSFERSWSDSENVEVVVDYLIRKGLETEPKVLKEVDYLRKRIQEEKGSIDLTDRQLVLQLLQTKPYLFYQRGIEGHTPFLERTDLPNLPIFHTKTSTLLSTLRQIEEKRLSNVVKILDIFLAELNGKGIDNSITKILVPSHTIFVDITERDAPIQEQMDNLLLQGIKYDYPVMFFISVLKSFRLFRKKVGDKEHNNYAFDNLLIKLLQEMVARRFSQEKISEYIKLLVQDDDGWGDIPRISDEKVHSNILSLLKEHLQNDINYKQTVSEIKANLKGKNLEDPTNI